MSSKINHVAIVSSQYALLGKFYESLLGMTSSSKVRPHSALTIGDGYVGLNINPRKPGRPAGLDHFGVEVESVEEVFDKMNSKYPSALWVKRPGNRPFAGITANDPDGNVFDLSQKKMERFWALLMQCCANQHGKKWASYILKIYLLFPKRGAKALVEH